MVENKNNWKIFTIIRKLQSYFRFKIGSFPIQNYHGNVFIYLKYSRSGHPLKKITNINKKYQKMKKMRMAKKIPVMSKKEEKKTALLHFISNLIKSKQFFYPRTK